MDGFKFKYFLSFFASNTFCGCVFSGKKDKTFNMIIGFVASVIMILIFILIVTWVSYQIPLSHNPKLSYSLNFVLQFLFWFLIVYTSRKNNKSTSTAISNPA